MRLSCDLYNHLAGYFKFKGGCTDLLLIIQYVSVFIRNGHTEFTGGGYDLRFQNRWLPIDIDRSLLKAIVESICGTPVISSAALGPSHLEAGACGRNPGFQDQHEYHNGDQASADPDPIPAVDMSGSWILRCVLISISNMMIASRVDYSDRMP